MFSTEELQHEIDIRKAFQQELEEYPQACWLGGVNVPEFFTVEQKRQSVEVNIKYCLEGLRMLDADESPRCSLPITLGAIRIGDLYLVLSPGENFTITGKTIREQSPFKHTLICGDINGLFGYIDNDEEIDRGGYETDTYWKMLYIDGFRLALKKGISQRIISTSLALVERLHGKKCF
jgi:hypothetical protein